MSPSSYPAPKSKEYLVSPAKGGIFDTGLAGRLKRAKSSSEPLISQLAKNLLKAERAAVEALMIIEDMKNSGGYPHTSEPEPEIKAEAQVIQLPILQQLKPIEGLNTDVPAANVTELDGFQPVVYSNEESDLSEDDDSGLTVITADMEDDERVCADFGFDEVPAGGEMDEWDELYAQVIATQTLGFLDRLLKKTDSKDPQKLAEKLGYDPDFHLSEDDNGKKN